MGRKDVGFLSLNLPMVSSKAEDGNDKKVSKFGKNRKRYLFYKNKVRPALKFLNVADHLYNASQGGDIFTGLPRIRRPIGMLDQPGDGGYIPDFQALKDDETRLKASKMASTDRIGLDDFTFENEHLPLAIRQPFDMSEEGRERKLNFVKSLVSKFKK